MNRLQSNEVPMFLGSPPWGWGGVEEVRKFSADSLALGVDSRSYLFFARGDNLAILEAGTPLGDEFCSFANGKSQEVEFGLSLDPRGLAASSSAPRQVTLTLTVPEYSNKRVSRPVQVYFYVSNGRRKRSPTQSFKFLPGAFWHRPWWRDGDVGAKAGAEGCSAPWGGAEGWMKPGLETWAWRACGGETASPLTSMSSCFPSIQ